ncbi:MAG: universal stress protein [Rhodospirillales bacterium]|nr:universal stress protein [Rhodospirillales bacterium]MDH3920076.1 universal stress protein [Rhodospirillales bacterium]MDH3967518.1 universal stress protein [Rhodospirillales bacterium]
MYKKILLSIDLNDETSWTASLETALVMCRTFDASLHLIHVLAGVPDAVAQLYLPDDSTERLVKEFTEMMDAFIDENIPKEYETSVHLSRGSIYAGILETAKKVEADLIIIGAHRPTMGDFLLGPNAARVVRHAECSVLVVRG